MEKKGMPEFEPASDSSTDFDPNDYIAELAEFDISEADKIEMLRALWSSMRIAFEMGLRVDIVSAISNRGSEAAADPVSSTFNNNSNEGTGQR